MTPGGALDAALAAARQTAAAEGHAFVGTEHLLAALLAAPDGLAAMLLSRAGQDLPTFRAELLRGMRKSGGPAADPETIPTSRQAARVLERAREGAGDESALLAALLSTGGGRIPRLLPPDSAAHQAVLAAVGGAPKAAAQPSAEPRKRPRSDSAADDRPPKGRGEPEAAQRPVRERRTEAPSGRKDARSRTEPARRREEPALPPATAEEAASRPIVRSLREPARRRIPWTLLLLLAVPVSIGLELAHAPDAVVFASACVAVLPLAGLMGTATEALAERAGPTIGGLLNATFGNAAELIIAVAALNRGLVDLVKASITGSILGNLLLILGLSCVAAGTGRETVRFSRTNAGMSSAMLALAVVGLVFPALFHSAHPGNLPAELHLSEIVAGILIATYGFSLLFSLRTHRSLLGCPSVHSEEGASWSLTKAWVVLGLATVAIAVESEILVRTVEGVTRSLGLSELFLGLIVVPVIGNAAEHASAVLAARRGQMDLAFQIALGSSTQIALLVAPLLVYIGLLVGTSMNLVLPVFEVLALGVSTVVIAIITLDGETHWFEGVQLLAVYGLIATAAYFI